jgi:hypothetical protein
MMNATPDATAAANGGSLDPQQAAALLHQTTLQARRRLQPSPPWLLVTRAVLVLIALGAIWLSVRGQHPYHGPTAADGFVLVAFVVVNFAATVTVRQRALAGVRGRSRLRPVEVTILLLAWVAVAAVMVALSGIGVSYIDYPTTVLIVPGLAWAGIAVARKNWMNCATGLGVALVGVAGLMAGPAGSWAVAGVGLCAVLLGTAAVIRRRARA